MGNVRHSAVRLSSILVLAALALAAVPQGPALADPCAPTSGAAALGARVCVDGRTAHLASAPVSRVELREHAGVRFVTFDVEAVGAYALLSRDAAAWSAPLPAGDELRLRGPNEGADAVEGPYRLLLLRTPMVSEWSASLAERGVSVHAYVPDNAFLVRMPAGFASDVSSLPFVRSVTALAPLAKLEPGLAGEGGTPLVNILTVPGGPGAREETLAALARVGAQLVQDAPEIERVTARVAASRLVELAATPGIMWIDRASEEAEADMDRIRGMTGARDLASLATPFTGAGVVGQVMDVGFDAAHQDFAKSLIATDGRMGFDSHGTAVYGIVFGSGDGNPTALGMAPDAKGVMAWSGSGQTRYAHAQHLRDNWSGVFQTHSWGRGVPKDNTYDSYSNENDRVVQDLDVLMLQSMSNCGPLCARREAMAKNILSIGALYHLDSEPTSDDVWSTGGSRASTGPAADGRIKPELAGPYDLIFTTYPYNGYTFAFGGTSGATPVVAGAVALTNEMWTKGVFAGSAGVAEPSTVKALLVASAQPYLPYQVVHSQATQTVGQAMQRNIQGWGLPDLAALHGAGASALVVDGTVALETGEAASFTYAPSPAATATRITLAWTDVPANPGAATTLVNDLDLEVTDAAGAVVWRGNVGLLDAPFSQPGGMPDTRNNLENVFLPAGVAGPLTISVRGSAVNLDADATTPEVDQPFSLVALSVL